MVNTWLTRIVVVLFLYLVVLEPLWNHLLTGMQHEAQYGLATIYNTEIKHHAAQQEWCDDFTELGIGYEADAKYAFFLAPNEHEGKSLEALGLTLPIDFDSFGAPVPGLTEDGFVAVAIGNIDLDSGLDVWWVNEEHTMINSNTDLWKTWEALSGLFD